MTTGASFHADVIRLSRKARKKGVGREADDFDRRERFGCFYLAEFES